MSIVKSARLNTVIGKRDGKSLTFLNLIVESTVGDFKTTVKISFLCKGKGVAPILLKTPFNLDRKIIQEMLDEAKVLLLPKENNKSTSVVYEFRGTFKENNESTKTNKSSKPVANTDEDSKKVLKNKKSTKTRKSSKPVVNTDEDDIMSV